MLIKNQYQVLKTLGEGGFGTAYLAKDTHMPSERQCVVKELKPISDNQDVYTLIQERFQREAAILEQLGENHPQIPRLYSYFSEDQKFYLVQEWIEGTTLEMLASQPKAPNESMVRSLLTSLLHVLDYVHSKGIIHRDIKPENIILRQGTGEPVLIDFGAVRETMGTVTAGGKTMAPASSIVIGTPGYMSSEQATGRPVPASDLYSLALTAVYLLTGQTPQAMQAHPQTGELLWQDAADAVSPELMAVLTKAVAYHPRDRYSSAKEMLTALVDLPSEDAQPAMAQADTVINTSPVMQTAETSQNARSADAYTPERNTQVAAPSTSETPETAGNSRPIVIVLSAIALAAISLGSLWGVRQFSTEKIGAKTDPATQSTVQTETSDPTTATLPETTDTTETEPEEEQSNVGEPDTDEPDTETNEPTPAPVPIIRDSVVDGDKCFDLFAYDPDDTMVNLRDAPDGERLAQLPNLTRVGANGPASVEPGWNEVITNTNATNGYIWGDLLYRVVYQVQDPTDSTVNFRETPNGDILAEVANDTEVRFGGLNGDWTRVELANGQVGFMSTSLLAPPDCF
ncbi:MAG: serine/threonine protein kinase [Cyanobacteria bacterium J06627_28]